MLGELIARSRSKGFRIRMYGVLGLLVEYPGVLKVNYIRIKVLRIIVPPKRLKVTHSTTRASKYS